MTPLNKPLLRIQYEVLHDSIEDMAQEHGVSEAVIRYAIESEGWARQPVTNLSPTEDQTEIETATTAMQQRLDAAHTLRQGILDPQYIKIEAALTAKTIDVINSIQATEPTAAKRLRDLMDILATLRPTKAMIDKNNSDGNAGIKLMIMNHVGEVRSAKDKEIEVVVGLESGDQGVTRNTP